MAIWIVVNVIGTAHHMVRIHPTAFDGAALSDSGASLTQPHRSKTKTVAIGTRLSAHTVKKLRAAKNVDDSGIFRLCSTQSSSTRSLMNIPTTALWLANTTLAMSAIGMKKVGFQLTTAKLVMPMARLIKQPTRNTLYKLFVSTAGSTMRKDAAPCTMRAIPISVGP